MPIRHLGHTHNTVAEVRACSSDYGNAKVTAAAKATAVIEREQPLITEKQVAFITRLVGEHVLPASFTAPDPDDLPTITRAAAGKLIDALKSYPQKPAGTRDDHVPAGRYALQSDGVWRFYQIDKPTQGKWAGRVFINQLIGAPGDYRRQRAGNGLQVIADISKNPRQASLDYGRESGHCGVCSSPLTNDESLALGIGPVCRAKRGW
jgi:hypothetical protein